MPLSLAFRFPAGRYHATPFGHHVNEGLIEWPPSPWRLMRALICVGYTSGAWDGAGPPPVARRLIEKLCAELPRYHLPPAIGAHSRHYMPLGVLESKTQLEKTTLVFDAWARIADGEEGNLVVTWPGAAPDAAELSLLRLLAGRLNYLGRSESWVEGRVLGENEQAPEANCIPEDAQDAPPSPGSDREQIALLAPDSAPDFEIWRAARLGEALADLPLPEGKKKPVKTLLAKREKAAAPYPEDLLDCLQKDTAWLRAHGWNRPPGSRRVFYRRPSGAISVSPAQAPSARRSARRVAAMLLSLTNASRNDHALPPVTRTLPQAELLRQTLVGIAERRGAPPNELTGRDGDGRPLRGRHEHLHVNPLDLDGDGHLDHILVWAPGGLGADAQAAVRAARKTHMKGSVEPLRLAVAGSGPLPQLARLPGAFGQRLAALVGCSARWRTLTPFVPPRHLKPRGKNALECQLRAELASRGLPEPVDMHPVPPGGSGSATAAADDPAPWKRFRHYALARQRGPQPPHPVGFAIRLTFDRPIPGPIALGYGAHFGLGLFEAAPEA